jgi:hypothetical protein
MDRPAHSAYSYTVGRVLRASTSGFDCGTRSSSINGNQNFGAFVTVPISDDGRASAIGLIYAIRIDDDPLARELVMAAGVDNSTLLDQRENRMVPVEICVLNIGCAIDGATYHTLPPRPPMSLAEVSLMTREQVVEFTRRDDFIRLVLNARDAQPDDLLAAALNYAAACHADDARYDFLVRCGRRVATLLSHDLKRISHVLTMIAPQQQF